MAQSSSDNGVLRESVAARVSLRRIYTSGQLSEEGKIPSVEWQIYDGLLVDDLTNRSIFCL